MANWRISPFLTWSFRVGVLSCTVSSCSPYQTKPEVGIQLAGAAASATGRGTVGRALNEIAETVEESDPVYARYPAYRIQRDFATAQARTKKSAPNEFQEKGEPSDFDPRFVIVPVPKENSLKRRIQNAELEGKRLRSVMIWDTKKQRLADANVFEVHANQVRRGRSIRIGSRKVFYTGR